MDEVLDAGSLQVVHAGRSTSYNKHRTAIEILEGRDGIFGILIIAGADNHDVGLSLEGSINTFFDGLEAEGRFRAWAV